MSRACDFDNLLLSGIQGHLQLCHPEGGTFGRPFAIGRAQTERPRIRPQPRSGCQLTSGGPHRGFPQEGDRLGVSETRRIEPVSMLDPRRPQGIFT